jgi:hypothetical protein
LAEIRIQNEQETGRGWAYDVIVGHGGDEPPREHRVMLSWADYEYWSHGQKPPADVVRQIVAYLLEQPGFTPPAKFDASTARRWFPSLDRHFQGEMG